MVWRGDGVGVIGSLVPPYEAALFDNKPARINLDCSCVCAHIQVVVSAMMDRGDNG